MIAMVCVLPLFSQTIGKYEVVQQFALGHDWAYFMSPPVSVCNSNVSDLAWSADGKRLLVVRDPYDSNPAQPAIAKRDAMIEVDSWDSVSRKSTKIWSAKASEKQLAGIDWIAGTSDILLQVRTPDDDLKIVDVSSVTGKSVMLATGKETMLAFVNPVTPSFAIFEQDPNGDHKSVRLLNIGGQTLGPFSLPASTYPSGWSPDGRSLDFVTRNPGNPSLVYSALDQSTGKLVPSDGPAYVEDHFELTAVQGKASATLEGAVANPDALWLMPADNNPAPRSTVGKRTVDPDVQPGLVSAEGYNGIVAPSMDAVAYVYQGTAMVRQISRVSKDLYTNARNAETRTALLLKAKQVGLALIMWANDNDDKYPPNSGWQDGIAPYLGNNHVADGFNYTFAGGDLSSIAEPASTQLGFVTGPGGRAIVYADGHAKWIPD